MQSAQAAPLQTPLYEHHVKLGARMVEFGGWMMPLQYTGIIEEHLRTRNQATVFDTCHMGEFVLGGSSAAYDLERLVTCRIENLKVGRARYGLLTRADGTIIDDLISFRIGLNEFMLVVNASTRAKDAEWISQHLSRETFFHDISEMTAKIDLQGPRSRDALSRLIDPGRPSGLRRFSFMEGAIEGVEILISRTGYTGEFGYELFFPADRAGWLWERLLAIDGVAPAGLGARDTLRMEAGYPLYGNDIDDFRTPLEAGLERFVCLEKDFIGADALRRQAAEGPTQRLMAFVCEGRRAARHGFKVIADGREQGLVTSGAYSPCMKKAIGLCYIDRELARDGQPVTLTQEGTEVPAVIHGIPVMKTNP